MKVFELQKSALNIFKWNEIIRIEGLIYSIMNKFNFDTHRLCLVAEGWCPTFDISTLTHLFQTIDRENIKIIGIRLPQLRKIAKDLVKNNWQEFLNQNTNEYWAK